MFSDLLLNDWIGFSLWVPNINDEITLLTYLLLLLNIKFSKVINFYINQVSRYIKSGRLIKNMYI